MWILLLFSLQAFASDPASEKYCFGSPAESSTAREKFRAIQVPSDQLTMDGKCFTIQMSEHRHELIQRFIRSSFPNVSISFSSEDVRRDPCQLKVEKEKSKHLDSTQVGLDVLNQSTSTTNGSDVLKIQTLKDFNLTVDQDEIKGRCRFINPNRYEISLEVRKNPKPIVPVNLPPGTIVALNNPPPDQETSMLSTTLQLNRGERIEIGSIVKNLRDKGHDVSINPELKVETSSQSASEKVFLSVD
ncbi:hypothetical protein [Peredibacter starrii]|uniref:Uncharacterized protein n=1 Tax=Peredibacter starrii TaxID=28202 RepID=A0AAX4HSK0_9BACT|nr:hypothetical protein [Peredibacter starrii]WPU66016.1 hypothetical protein SOO65_04590 [Peredibacter starrii]